MTQPAVGPARPDPHSPDLKARCAGAVERLLRRCVGQGRGREVAFDLLTEVVMHHGDVLANWVGRTNAVVALDRIADRYARQSPREFMPPASASATLEALNEARDLMNREAVFWAQGGDTCKVLSWSFLIAGLERIAYQFGPAGAAHVARLVADAIRPPPIRQTAAAQDQERRP